MKGVEYILSLLVCGGKVTCCRIFFIVGLQIVSKKKRPDLLVPYTSPAGIEPALSG